VVRVGLGPEGFERRLEALVEEPVCVLFGLPDVDDAKGAVRARPGDVADAPCGLLGAELALDLVVVLRRSFGVVDQHCDRHVRLLTEL
jgi:hypothetical protein